uniref:Uncharacterized protein n=1 Tax=Cricetulus griseus TaxID=10029 RepID=A0A8C2LE13_CRIGR
MGEAHGSQGTGLPELYDSAKNFSKESKKSNFQKICRTSLEEARQLLDKNLNATSSCDTDKRKDKPLPAIQTRKEKPKSMADVLHHSLLKGFLFPLEQIAKTQKRLVQVGIPPPVHTFPYEFRADEVEVTQKKPTSRKRTSSATFHKLLLDSVTPDRLVYEDKLIRFFPPEPGKQFLDLVDLEWRYFKGLASWGRVRRGLSFIDIQFTSEKRFVESQGMSGMLSPPLVRKTLMYPQTECHKDGFYHFKWNT